MPKTSTLSKVLPSMLFLIAGLIISSCFARDFLSSLPLNACTLSSWSAWDIVVNRPTWAVAGTVLVPLPLTVASVASGQVKLLMPAWMGTGLALRNKRIPVGAGSEPWSCRSAFR